MGTKKQQLMKFASFFKNFRDKSIKLLLLQFPIIVEKAEKSLETFFSRNSCIPFKNICFKLSFIERSNYNHLKLEIIACYFVTRNPEFSYIGFAINIETDL